MNSTQKQRDFITSLCEQITVEKAYEAGCLTIDQAFDAGFKGGYRTPREVARHCNSSKVASETIGKLLAAKKSMN